MRILALLILTSCGAPKEQLKLICPDVNEIGLVQTVEQLPACDRCLDAHYFVIKETKWYYCDGEQWRNPQ